VKSHRAARNNVSIGNQSISIFKRLGNIYSEVQLCRTAQRAHERSGECRIENEEGNIDGDDVQTQWRQEEAARQDIMIA
jgi:hypothetical protein